MTAHTVESLIYQGQKRCLFAQPLEDWFERTGIRSPFRFKITWNRRGYVGIWEIKGDSLFLIEWSGSLADGSEGNLSTLFPDHTGSVFAYWYSGTLCCPVCEMLEYRH